MTDVSTAMTRRTISPDVPLEPAEAPTGAGEISKLAVWSHDGWTHGVWEMTPGVLRGVPGPESVCIIAGRASVVLHPGGEDIALGPGDVLVVDEGETADWTVTETVRKFFVVNR